MRCIVCGKELEDYALIGKKGEIKAAFCARHAPDCEKCDACDLHCVKCRTVRDDRDPPVRARNGY